jgi:DNA gyrase subunit B
VYIAQPPLYKLKAGKHETYVKDDRELEDWLLRMALDGAELRTGDARTPLPEQRLAELMREHAHIDNLTARLARFYDPQVLRCLREALPVPNSAAEQAAWTQAFTQTLNSGESGQRFQVEIRVGEHSPVLRLQQTQHGVTRELLFGEGFFASSDHQALLRHAGQTRALVGANAIVRRGEREQAVANFTAAYDWLLAEARRSLNIQRYKGLGEMNPGQLWETTLDPAHRRLVRVQVEDIVAADQMFTTLMGEDVEPRRDFIERHALQVSNLDV